MSSFKGSPRIKELEARIDEEAARATAISEIAAKEDRELTAEEAKEVDAIIDEENGSVAKLKAQLEREQKILAIAKERLSPRIEEQQERFEGINTQKITVPASARSRRELRAFKGENAEKDAYVSGMYFMAHVLNHKPAQEWCESHGVRASLSTDNNEKGGVFVIPEHETATIRLVEEYGVFRRYADVVPMGSDTKIYPVRTGGMTAYPVAETNTANEGSNTGTKSDPAYTNVELVARKWKAWLKMSDELNEDAVVMMADKVAVESALAFAYAEDNSGFNGDGTSTYHGITGVLNAVAAGSVHTAAAGNTAFSTLDLQDFIDMKGKLPEYPNIMPAWFISKEGYCASMERLQMAAGGFSPADIASGGLPRFLGAPVVFTNVLNSTLTAQTSTKILAYGDLRMAALLGDRRGISYSLTDQRYWDEDQIAIKATERFDIDVHSKGTASAAGAILVMATPGS